METSHTAPPPDDGFPPPLTPERAKRALARVTAIHERIRRRGIDLTRLPDPVEALVKARAVGNWDEE